MEEQLYTRADGERDVLIMAERLALLHYYFVREAVARYGEEEARALAEAAIAAYGEECGRLTRQRVEGQGLENTLTNHHLGGDLPRCGWQAQVLEQDEQHKRVRIDFCPLAATWRRYGADEWGRLYCGVDETKHVAYNENLTFSAEKNVLEGDDCCLQVITVKNRPC